MKVAGTKISTIWEKTSFWLWIALVICLPVTSLPIFAKILHTSSVAPASGLIVLILAVIWLPVYILRGGRFPFQAKIAVYLALFCVLTGTLAFFRESPFYPGSSITSNLIETFATLGMGILFYISSTGLPSSDQKITLTLKAVNIGGAIMLAWSLIQIIVWLPLHDFPQWVRDFQSVFSSTVLFDRRTTGFASEPSWLAHQLNLVYLPLWLAATIKKTSLYKFRLWFLSIENILLGIGLVVLFLTFSRGGLGAFMLVLAFLFILLNVKLVRWLMMHWKVKRRLLVSIITAGGVFLIYLAIGVLGLFVLSKIDPRMESVFQFNSDAENPVMKYVDNLQFGERVIYWQTGWRIFNDYPIVGVGLSNSGAYFPDYMPEYGWQLTETKNLLFQSDTVLNIKNLWTRLLGETGIIGFSLFLVFLVAGLITSIELIRNIGQQKATIGWMGIFMLVAFIIEGLSVDSVALPYYWFTLGLVAATWRWSDSSTRSLVNG
jgi:hypothetical protein